MRCFNQYRPPNLKLGVGGCWICGLTTSRRSTRRCGAHHRLAGAARAAPKKIESCAQCSVVRRHWQGDAAGAGQQPLASGTRIETSPTQVMGRFNGFLKLVILRSDEARDLGEFNRYTFYDHLKAYTAAPPDVLRVDRRTCESTAS